MYAKGLNDFWEDLQSGVQSVVSSATDVYNTGKDVVQTGQKFGIIPPGGANPGGGTYNTSPTAGNIPAPVVVMKTAPTQNMQTPTLNPQATAVSVPLVSTVPTAVVPESVTTSNPTSPSDLDAGGFLKRNLQPRAVSLFAGSTVAVVTFAHSRKFIRSFLLGTAMMAVTNYIQDRADAATA